MELCYLLLTRRVSSVIIVEINWTLWVGSKKKVEQQTRGCLKREPTALLINRVSKTLIKIHYVLNTVFLLLCSLLTAPKVKESLLWTYDTHTITDESVS